MTHHNTVAVPFEGNREVRDLSTQSKRPSVNDQTVSSDDAGGTAPRFAGSGAAAPFDARGGSKPLPTASHLITAVQQRRARVKRGEAHTLYRLSARAHGHMRRSRRPSYVRNLSPPSPHCDY